MPMTTSMRVVILLIGLVFTLRLTYGTNDTATYHVEMEVTSGADDGTVQIQIRGNQNRKLDQVITTTGLPVSINPPFKKSFTGITTAFPKDFLTVKLTVPPTDVSQYITISYFNLTSETRWACLYGCFEMCKLSATGVNSIILMRLNCHYLENFDSTERKVLMYNVELSMGKDGTNETIIVVVQSRFVGLYAIFPGPNLPGKTITVTTKGPEVYWEKRTIGVVSFRRDKVAFDYSTFTKIVIKKVKNDEEKRSEVCSPNPCRIVSGLFSAFPFQKYEYKVELEVYKGGSRGRFKMMWRDGIDHTFMTLLSGLDGLSTKFNPPHAINFTHSESQSPSRVYLLVDDIPSSTYWLLGYMKFSRVGKWSCILYSVNRPYASVETDVRLEYNVHSCIDLRQAVDYFVVEATMKRPTQGSMLLTFQDDLKKATAIFDKPLDEEEKSTVRMAFNSDLYTGQFLNKIHVRAIANTKDRDGYSASFAKLKVLYNGQEVVRDFCAQNDCEFNSKRFLTMRIDSPCKSGPCLYGAECSVKFTKYQCSCVNKYSGKRCENPPSCSREPCQNGGMCVEAGNNFHCDCLHDFGGPLCEKDLNMVAYSYAMVRFLLDYDNSYLDLDSDKSRDFKSAMLPALLEELLQHLRDMEFVNIVGLSDGSLVVNLEIGTGSNEDDFNRIWLENDVRQALVKVLADGKVGNMSVDPDYLEVTQVGQDKDLCVMNPCEYGGTCAQSSHNEFNCTCAEGFSGERCERGERVWRDNMQAPINQVVSCAPCAVIWSWTLLILSVSSTTGRK